MSTPSTATATIHHPHHAHYGYSHHQSYQPNSAHQSPNESTLTTANSRLNHAYNTYQNLNSTSTRNSAVSAKQSTTTTAKSPSPSTSIMSKPRTRRNPDWADFFKNGVPQEIIVIEDDSPPPSRSQQRVPNYHSQNDGGTPIEHASKKRRTGLAYGDAPARQQVTYSNTNTPRFDASGSGTISTDRTTSIHTTAPTSLGSHTSVGRVSYVETTTTGQKRKRITRQATADEKKRKQVDSVADAYSSYVPPPRPPIKATEVPVRVVKDVSTTTIVDWIMILSNISPNPMHINFNDP